VTVERRHIRGHLYSTYWEEQPPSVCVFVSREGAIVPRDVAERHGALPDCVRDQYDDAVVLLRRLLHQSGVGVDRKRRTLPDLHLHRSQVTIIMTIIKISVLYFFCLPSLCLSFSCTVCVFLAGSVSLYLFIYIY